MGELDSDPGPRAVRYYAEYPDEIDERIRRSVEEADTDEERRRGEQNALA